MSETEIKKLPANAIYKMGKHGYPEWALVPTDVSTHAFTGDIHQIVSWSVENPDDILHEQVGVIFLKWDGCCHIGVGDPQLGNAWAHVCGKTQYAELLEALAWAREEAKKRIEKFSEVDDC